MRNMMSYPRATHFEDVGDGFVAYVPREHPLTPEDSRIRDELVNRIHHEAFASGIDADITGEISTMKQLGDRLAERASKVILLGSLAPSTKASRQVLPETHGLPREEVRVEPTSKEDGPD